MNAHRLLGFNSPLFGPCVVLLAPGNGHEHAGRPGHMRIGTLFGAALLAVSALCAAAQADSVPLVSDRGSLRVPAVINGEASFNFTIDSGAAEVCIPANIFYSLTRDGTVSQRDFLDRRPYKLADGSIHYAQRFRIRSLAVGGLKVSDVVASVVPAAGSLLLGQSFLSRLKSWSIDNERQVLAMTPLTPSASSFAAPVATNLNGRSGWVRLSALNDPAGALYVNTTGFKGDGNIRWFSEKHIFPPHARTWLGKWVDYSLNQWEMDCGDEHAKLAASSNIYEDGTHWVADARLLASAAWHPIRGDAWKESEMQLLCRGHRPGGPATR
jgi:clan AA aspartic protease (TIGR02281 family)